jgi:TrkA-N domain
VSCRGRSRLRSSSHWLEAGPGAELPERGRPPSAGRWVMCGYGRLGREITADLRAAGLDVTIIEPAELAEPEPGVIVGDASEPAVLARADLASAVGLVAATDNDTTNLSMLATPRRLNPQLFLAGRQNRPTSAALFEAMRVDALLVPTEVVAHEVYAQISTPMLWRFIQQMPAQGASGQPISSSGCSTTAAASSPRSGRSSWTGSRRRLSAGSRQAESPWGTCCGAPRIGSGDSMWCHCCCSGTAKPSSHPTARQCWRATMA